MNAIRKTKHRCKVCNDYIKVYRHNAKFSYCLCDRCNIMYVIDRKTDKWVRSYEPRKLLSLTEMDGAVYYNELKLQNEE